MFRLDVKDQEEILGYCIKTGRPLHEVLEAKGLTYEALSYERYKPDTKEGGEFKTIEGYRKPSHRTQVVSFFSGCGGMDLGFEAAGYEHVACIDNNVLFCETLRVNRRGWNVVGPPYGGEGDISKRDDLLRALKPLIGEDFEGVFIGGPPCQSFSVAANQRFAKWGDNFKRIGFRDKSRGNLLLDFVWFIKQFRPAAFVIENVPGLARIDGGYQVRLVTGELAKSGYTVSEPKVMDAAHYGVPQWRKRMFIVGSKKATMLFPNPSPTRVPSHKALSLPINGSQNHITRLHRAESVKRYMGLDYGDRDDLGRVDRLDPNEPAKTVIAGGTKGGGRSHLHPSVPRTMSVRECARLQTFPDSFTFYGSLARQFTQVGNAVPPVLAWRLAKAMADQDLV